MDASPTPGFALAQIGIGMALSTMLMAAILWHDPMGLGQLLLRAEEHPLPLGLLWLFCALTFGTVQFGVAIMLRYEA